MTKLGWETTASGQNVSVRFEQSPSILVFSPWYYGHHPSYLRHLIQAWNQQKQPGTLNIVVMQDFLKKHSDVVALAHQHPDQTVHFLPLAPEEQAGLGKARSLIQAWIQYRLIRDYAAKLQATHCLVTYFDACLIPFVFGAKMPCSFSGIYYRPTFYYARNNLSWKDRLQRFREWFSLARLFAHPQFKVLFCLDPLAVNPINQAFQSHAIAVSLADPVTLDSVPHSEVNALKQQLGIETGRKVFLAFGSLAESRKGTDKLIESLSLLEPDACEQICLLFVGEPFPERQALLESWLAPIRRSHSSIQIVTQFGYVAESDVSRYFQLCDAVLAPYQKHLGTSGILLLAAIAQKPILSTNYGLMGQLVHQQKLGVAVDTTIPSEIAKGLLTLLQTPTSEICDIDKMRELAEQNSVEQFTATIFEHVLSVGA